MGRVTYIIQCDAFFLITINEDPPCLSKNTLQNFMATEKKETDVDRCLTVHTSYVGLDKKSSVIQLRAIFLFF